MVVEHKINEHYKYFTLKHKGIFLFYFLLCISFLSLVLHFSVFLH